MNEEKTAKATVTKEFSKAIHAIAQRSNRTESDIFRNAIEYYLKNNYPEFLPKSRLEIENKVKEAHQYEKLKEKYRSEQYLIENIPAWENILAISRGKIKKLEKEIDDIEGQLRVIAVGKKNEKLDLENKLHDLKTKLKVEMQYDKRHAETLANAKQGEIMGA